VAFLVATAAVKRSVDSLFVKFNVVLFPVSRLLACLTWGDHFLARTLLQQLGLDVSFFVYRNISQFLA
jgi:hypothetical protein